MSADDHSVSKSVIRLSNELDNIRFAGTDQNPKGIRDRLFCLSSQVRNLESSYRDLPSSHFIHGHWECKDSPTGSCIYTESVGSDCCIFCRNPEERK